MFIEYLCDIYMIPNNNNTLLQREHRTDSGQLKTHQLNITSVAIETLCQSCLRLVKHASQAKKLKVSATFDTLSMMTTVQADKARLRQILLTLLYHAIEVTPEGKAIGLKVRADLKSKMLHLCVWYQSVGNKLDLMMSLQSSLDSNFGLDFSLVKNLIDLHGGGLLFETNNHLRKENRLTLSLPWQENHSCFYTSDKSNSVTPFWKKSHRGLLKQSERKEDTVKAWASLTSHMLMQDVVIPTTSAVKSESVADDYASDYASDNASQKQAQPLILLAEDNEANVSTLMEYLPTKGYRVVVARDGMDALQCAHQMAPDLILMDVQMPSMDGLEATRALRKHSSFAHTPIIALTALAMRGDRERCFEAGVNDYLSKPFSLKHLVTLIEKNLKECQSSS